MDAPAAPRGGKPAPPCRRQPARDLSYVEAADPKMELLEMNGAPSAEARVAAYVEALDAGWRVSPSWNSDTHFDNWGSGTNRTIVYPSSLTREHLRDAMHARRTAASNDRDAGLVLRADGCWMGSSLAGWTSATFEVAATDASAGDTFTSITLVGPAGAELASIPCAAASTCSATTTLDLLPPLYVFAVATQADGDQVDTAPLWFDELTGSVRSSVM